MKQSQLIVPGSYRPKAPPVFIAGIGSEVEFLLAPGRPRRLTIHGSDGSSVDFVLQSNADTRLDARFMQFYEFANRFIGESDPKLKAKLALLTRTVLPLTPSVGLVSWVADAATLRQLIVRYRTRYQLPIGQEEEIVNSQGGGQMELFQKALAVSNGNELQRFLLSGALDSEDWLGRRLNYTASLAATSIVGHLLGLVRRDPDAIVIQQRSARLFHVQLKECFERQKETVPFRLTRVLTNALEVSKIEGTFRTCSEDIMKVMKQNGRELALLLEVFIDDPLYQWGAGLPRDFMVERMKEKCAPEGAVADGITRLLADATALQNQAQMPASWAPWW
jgi:FKBP12-rapamycin complex-associated protein